MSKTVVEHDGKTYGLGRHPLPRDDRDFLLRNMSPEKLEAIKAPAERTTTRTFYTMVGKDFRIDQGQEGTCVGHGCTNVLLAGPVVHSEFPSFDNTTDAHIFARKLYFDASGDSTYQQGTYTRKALNVLLQRGQIGAYVRLTSVDEIVDTVLNHVPVTFGSTWYNNMFRPRSEYNNSYLRVDTSSGVAGGHLYCITGVNLAPAEGPPYVRMENSWGPTWGHDGTARIPLDDLHVLYDGDAFMLTENPF